MDWFEEWFDSPLYQKLYSNRDESEAKRLIALLEKDLQLRDETKILDLGCGRGRHSITLAQKGYQVSGIDLSEASIESAKEEAASLGLGNVHFKVRDMRNPLPQTFDAIFSLFTTFGYFMDDEENQKVLDNVVHMLRPGGRFVLDFLNAQKVRQSFKPSDEGSFQQVRYNIKRYIKDEAIHKDIHFTNKSTGEEKTFSERVKLYDFAWFKKEMNARNLVIDHVYGDYSGADFDPESSPRLLIVTHLERGARSEKQGVRSKEVFTSTL